MSRKRTFKEASFASSLHAPKVQQRSSMDGGFSLVEIIITLVLISLAGLALFQFMNTTVPVSSQPARWVADEAEMGVALEEITAEFIHDVTDDANINATDFNTFLDTFATTATGKATGKDLTVTTDKGCFDSSGALISTCGTNDAPVLRVVVEDDNGRKYSVLYAQTRLPGDPQDAR